MPRPTSLLAAIALTSAAIVLHTGIAHADCTVSSPPAALHLDGFYRKYCSASGVPIVASARVPDQAVIQSARIVSALLAPLPDVRSAMVARNLYVMVLGTSERTTDLPEERGQPDSLNTRARGLFSGGQRPYVFAAEENILAYERDAWRGENILLHELAHAFDVVGFQATDRRFAARLQAAYAGAMRAGKYDGLYAATDAREYWAEGMQDYFGVHQKRDPHDINTRDQLAAYDPALYALLDEKLRDVRLPDMSPRPAFSPSTWYRIENVGRGDAVALDDSDIRATERVSGQYWHVADNRDGTFRLTNMYMGDGASLDVANDGVFAPQMAKTGRYSGQYWAITPITTGQFRLVSLFKPAQSLAAGTEHAELAVTSDTASEAWTFSPIGN